MSGTETKVGIRELKARLSQYVRLVRHGGRVVVTDRGEEVAELRAITPVNPGLRELIDSGLVRWSGGKPERFPKPVKIRGGPISDTVGELRERVDPVP
jgi:antitoxin (DNA-binding transcriptional repressor) of toxin-antitoxin stability system